MNKEEFIKSVKELNIPIDNEKLEKLDKYYKLIKEYNSHTNLTRIIEEEDVYLKHFYDSLSFVKIIDLDNQSLLDIGTGAGFPGIVLKIFYPNLKVTLIDSLNKRIIFLKDVREKLNLDKLEIHHARAEEFIINNRGKFDIVTSRAVANLSVLSELSLPFVKKEGYFIPMKGEVREELKLSENAIKTLGGVIEKVLEFKLIKENSSRSLIKIKKITNTSLNYPRKFSEIKKKPLY